MKTAERREKRREDQARKLSKEEMTMLAQSLTMWNPSWAITRPNVQTQPPAMAVLTLRISGKNFLAIAGWLR
jgi:hypothetical protein